ncbi:MAG: recombinase family protein [Gammaproteobacteria bacterium]|nr:recombinase family protein [Gammaproteobacteria bacterium]
MEGVGARHKPSPCHMEGGGYLDACTNYEFDDMEKTAVIYARVSTVRQADDELPLDSQIEQCKAKAHALGARVDRVFVDEGKSGRYDNRKEFQDAIAFCEALSPDYLVTWSTSRFARNKVDAGLYKLRLAKAGTDIVYVSLNIDRKTDGGWMTESVLELFDEFYSRQISADTIRSMLKNAREGFFNGGRPPYGFEVYPAPDNPKRKRLRHHQYESHIVRNIFELRANGSGALSIATHLQSEGITNRGAPWTKSSILALLRNDAVIGCAVFGRRDRATRRLRPRGKWIIVDSHEALISMDLWNQVQSMMDTAAVACDRGSPKSTYLFTGILHCEDGSSMQIESAKGRSKRYWYYNCRSAQKLGSGNNRRIAAREFDQWMAGKILDRILTRDVLQDVVEDLNDACGSWVKDHAERRQAVAGALSSVEGRNAKIYELFEQYGRDTPNLADLTKRLRKNNQEINELELQLGILDAEEQPEATVSQADIDDIAASLRYIIETAEDPRKIRQFFGSFIDRIWLGDDSVRIEYRPECLISNPEPILVPSKECWLPERSLLGTRMLVIDLPARFHRRVA